MYVTMVCDRSDAYASFYNAGEGRKSKKSGLLRSGSRFNAFGCSRFNVQGVSKISNDSRTAKHDGFLRFGIHPSTGAALDSTQPTQKPEKPGFPFARE
jgi:hypothetical protein